VSVRKLKKLFSLFLSFSLCFEPFVDGAGVFAVEPICLQPQDAVSPVVYNSASGYCETSPLDPTGKCPESYVFNFSTGKCVLPPMCPGNYIWDSISKQCVPVELTSDGSSSGFHLEPGTYYCAVDKDSNGDVGLNEVSECLETQQGYICPIDAVECSIVSKQQTIQTGQITLSGNVNAGYGVFVGTGNRLCNQETGTCLTFSVQNGQVVVSGKISKPNYWTFEGQGNKMVMTWVHPPCDGHYSTGAFVFKISETGISIVPETSPLNYLVSGCYFHAVANGNKIDFYNARYMGSITFTFNPGLTCPPGTTEISSTQCAACPYGSQYPCMNVSGTWKCSRSQCITANDLQDESPDTIPSGFVDDGEYDSEGECIGQVMIFNGYAMRCRTPGVSTGFQNCCDEANGKLYDSTGSLNTPFKTIKGATAAFYAATRSVEMGYYAYGIAEGKYIVKSTASGLSILAKDTGKTVASFAAESPEYYAISEAKTLVEQGKVVDEVVQGSMGTYFEKLGPEISMAVVNLAVSQLIDDPVLSSTINLAASVIVPQLMGAAVSPVGIALAVVNVAMSFLGGSCDKQDILTSTYKESGRCHYVGSKCIKKWPGVGCVQRKKVYCCFNSKLARIIHEQGRPQLKTFNGWGTPDDPVCRGFTPEEFQALDFSQMDLSEYYEDIERNVRENVQPLIQNQVEETVNSLNK